MNSRQRIKALKIAGLYDRRGKKYNDTPLIYIFTRYENLIQIMRFLYSCNREYKRFVRFQAKMLKESKENKSMLTTMKSYTDLEQSKKLVDILPI